MDKKNDNIKKNNQFLKNIYPFGLLLAFLCLQSCIKEEFDDGPLDGTEFAKKTVTYEIQEGVHHFTPISVDRLSSNYIFKIRVTFTKVQYLLKDQNGFISSDQRDYNKLSGFSDCNNFDAFTGKGAMIGWRWNETKRSVEFSAYVHNLGDQSRKIKEFKMTAKEGEVWEFKIAADRESKIYYYEAFNLETKQLEKITMSEEYGRGCGGIPITGRLITPWFGGNQVAPNDLKYIIEYL